MRQSTVTSKADYILQVNDLETRFHTEKGVVRAVDGISLDVKKGSIAGVVGESGCGKSMTALSVMGLVPSPPGQVRSRGIVLNGTDISAMDYKGMCRIRGSRMSMIFQEPMTCLNPVYTVGRQVGEALAIHGSLTRNQIKKQVIEMFDMVGIPEPAQRFKAFPHQLSGGLRQRVMIAMALICEPDLLIADEPTTALDVTIQAQILSLMTDLRKRIGTSIIMITHDLGVIAEMCDTVNVMYAGKIIEKGDVFDIFDHPLHPYTRGLLNSVPSIAAPLKEGPMDSIRGMVPSLLDIPKGCRFHPRCDHARTQCLDHGPRLVDAGDGHAVSCWRPNKKGRCS